MELKEDTPDDDIVVEGCVDVLLGRRIAVSN
jgi:hypothetical protein